MKFFSQVLCIILMFYFGLISDLLAERLRGRIRNISFKSKTIEILDFSTDKHKVFRFSDDTVTINARTIRDFHPQDNVEIRFANEFDLQSIKKMVVYVEKEKVITSGELKNLIFNSKEPYLLIDTRSMQDYELGHLPTSVWAPGERLSQYEHLLPIEKNILLIFYSHGVTSDQAISTARLVELEGYTNVKIYPFGFYAWKRYKLPILVDATWLISNLDPHTVLIDTRGRDRSIASHIKNAVAIPTQKILSYWENKNNKGFPLLPDKDAKIVLYGDNTYDNQFLDSYNAFLGWNYENVVILDGGYNEWALNFPVENAPARTHIRYKRYVAEGSITPKEFNSIVSHHTALILDVRTYQEAEKGRLDGAIHIPLSELESRYKELPKESKIIVHCVNGIRAQIGYSLLKTEGFERVNFLNSAIIIEKTGDYTIIGM